MPSNYRIVDARSGDDDGDDDDDTRQVVCVHECDNSPVNVCNEAFKPLLMTSNYFKDVPPLYCNDTHMPCTSDSDCDDAACASGGQPCGRVNDKQTWCSECDASSYDCTLGYSCDKKCVGAGSSTTNCLFGVYQSPSACENTYTPCSSNYDCPNDDDDDGEDKSYATCAEHYFDIYSQGGSYYYGICEPCIYKNKDANCDKHGKGAVGYLMRKDDTDMPEQTTCSKFDFKGTDVTLCSLFGLKDKGKAVKAIPTVSATEAVNSKTFYKLKTF